MLREIEPDEILSFQDPRSPQLLLSIDLSTSFTVENASSTGWQKQHQSTVLSITTILWGGSAIKWHRMRVWGSDIHI